MFYKESFLGGNGESEGGDGQSKPDTAHWPYPEPGEAMDNDDDTTGHSAEEA